jgi:nucleotide-binding universal stress UspA family protein
MIKLTNILVAIDFSDTSEAALNYGRQLALTFGARLHILHVVEHAFMSLGPEAVGLDFARLQGDFEVSAWNTLNRLITTEDRDQLTVITAVRSGHSPALTIAGYARAKCIDLVVVGTHGRGMLNHLVMGSVAAKVVRIAPCPVLTVHHPEREFIQPDAHRAVGNRSAA